MNTHRSRTVTFASLALAGAVLAWHTLAATPHIPARPPSVVATVNLKNIIDGLDEAKDTTARLQEADAASSRKLQELSERLRSIDKDLEQMKDRTDSKEYRELVGQKIEVATTARARKEVLAQLMAEEDGAATRALFLKVLDAIRRLAASEGIDAVLRDDSSIVPPERLRDRGDAPPHPITGAEVRGIIDQRQLLFGTGTIDVTGQLITMMNNEYSAARK